MDIPFQTLDANSCLITALKRLRPNHAVRIPEGQTGLTSLVTTLLEDLLPRIASFSTAFHVGGDKVCNSANTSKLMVSSPDDPQSSVDHLLSMLQSYNLTPIIWSDLILSGTIKFPTETIVQARHVSSHRCSCLAKITAAGHRALFRLNDDWLRTLSTDPLADIADDQKHSVIRGEVHLGGEATNEGMIWLRVAAAAEVLWRGKGNIEEESMERLKEMTERLGGRERRAGSGIEGEYERRGRTL